MQPQIVQSGRQGLKGKPGLLFYSTSRKETFCWKWWGLRKGNWRETVEMWKICWSSESNLLNISLSQNNTYKCPTPVRLPSVKCPAPARLQHWSHFLPYDSQPGCILEEKSSVLKEESFEGANPSLPASSAHSKPGFQELRGTLDTQPVLLDSC